MIMEVFKGNSIIASLSISHDNKVTIISARTKSLGRGLELTLQEGVEGPIDHDMPTFRFIKAVPGSETFYEDLKQYLEYVYGFTINYRINCETDSLEKYQESGTISGQFSLRSTTSSVMEDVIILTNPIDRPQLLKFQSIGTLPELKSTDYSTAC